MAAEADALISDVSKWKGEEEDSSPEAADQKADLTVPRPAAVAADVDDCSDDDEADPAIRNLNLISRRKLMPAEWIENMRKLHYEEMDLFNRAYDAVETDSEDEYDEAAAAEMIKRLWTSLDLSGLNAAHGDEAVAVYPAVFYDRKYRPQEADDQAPAAAADEASSSDTNNAHV